MSEQEWQDCTELSKLRQENESLRQQLLEKRLELTKNMARTAREQGGRSAIAYIFTYYAVNTMLTEKEIFENWRSDENNTRSRTRP